MNEIWVLMDRRKSTPTLLYLCAFPSAEAAVEYADSHGAPGYFAVRLKVENDQPSAYTLAGTPRLMGEKQ